MDELRHTGLRAGFGDHAGRVDVRGPEIVFAVRTAGHDSGAVEDGVVAGAAKDRIEKPWVAHIAGDAGEVRVAVRVRREVQTGDVMPMAQQMALKDSAKESGAAGYQHMGHQGC